MENDASINPNAQPVHTAESEKLSVKSLMTTPSPKEEEIVETESPSRAKRNRKSNTESPSSTKSTGTALCTIPHVAKFIECNQDNEEFLKLLHRLLFGTVGLQRLRKASILAFDGYAASEAAVAAERLAKCTTENLQVLAQVFNCATEAGAAAINAFLSKPEAVGESIVQPYTLDSINAAVATPLRAQRASAVRTGSASAVGTRSATRRSYQENSDSEAVESEPEQPLRRSSGTPLRNKRMKAGREGELKASELKEELKEGEVNKELKESEMKESVSTAEPSLERTAESTAEPSLELAAEPTAQPSVEPTTLPTAEQSLELTTQPSLEPTTKPAAELLPNQHTEPQAEQTAELLP